MELSPQELVPYHDFQGKEEEVGLCSLQRHAKGICLVLLINIETKLASGI